MAASLGWHRVVLNTIIREGEATSSKQIKMIEMGQKVFVEERRGRRARISKPVAGWCSFETPGKSGENQQILMPVGADEDFSTVSDFNKTKTGFEEKATKLNQTINQVVEQSKNVPEEEKQKLQQQLEELRKEKLAALESAEQYKKMAEQAEKGKKETQSLVQSLFTAENSNKPEHDYREDDVLLLANGWGCVIFKYTSPDLVDKNGTQLVGVELSGCIGNCNGTYEGKRYFNCKEDWGAFVPITTIKKKITAEELLLMLQKQCTIQEQLKNQVE